MNSTPVRTVRTSSHAMAWLAVTVLASVAMPAARATTTFVVTMDTSPLIGDPNGPYALDFQFVDGEGTGDGNNSVTIRNFDFGGGSWSGPPSVTLTDATFFADFTELFSPGPLLSFEMEMTTEIDAGGVPDAFSFALLDGGDSEVPTLGFADAFLYVELESADPRVQVFRSDLNRTDLDIPEPQIQYANEGVVPEGQVTWAVGLGLGGGIASLLARRQRVGGGRASIPATKPRAKAGLVARSARW